MSLALVVALPLLSAVLPPLLSQRTRSLPAAAAAAATLLALCLLLLNAPELALGRSVLWRVDWLPQLGLALSFGLDGLAFFFASLILGIGLLIIIYAHFYLAKTDPAGRFFGYLLLFQGSMLGIVVSNNLLLLVVFWELTSISSFLLIGYWNHLQHARQGARMALWVTGGGGFALMAGVLLLGHIAGSYEINEILERREAITGSPYYLPALLLILLGAFTKSAQFPFHFWLPHAMAAPTPVSAYLHSATMVKAGIFLMARLWPVLAGTDAWFYIVSLTGLVTMVIAAWIACFKDDLKALLAFSTVSHLGLVTMLLGFGTPYAVTAAMLHVFNHAVFKAALFMSVGIVDHETGTRDISRLGGLIRLMPIASTLSLIACASMAGIPLLNGFLSKEMMLEAAIGVSYAGADWLFPIAATAAALLSAAYSARLAFGVYLGPARRDWSRPPHDPSYGMWLPVALLVALVVGVGLFPDQLAGPVMRMASQAIIGEAAAATHLALWHGFTPALVASAVALAGGLTFCTIIPAINARRRALLQVDAKSLFDRFIALLVGWSRRLMAVSHTQVLHHHLAIAIAAIAAVSVVWSMTATGGAGNRQPLPVTLPAIVAWAALAVCCVALALGHRERLLAIILTSVVGLIVSLCFLQFSAPDLALTQISVEVVTTVLLLLALNLLPKTGSAEQGTWRLADGAISVAVGIGVGGAAYSLLTRNGDSISSYYIAQSVPGGGGANVVNVILVDFRGLDTFGEIIVLGVAALAIFAMLESALRGAAAQRLLAMRPGLRSADAHPLMLIVATRALLPLVVTAGVYIFLRGHNQPGGGFIAGLLVAIALIMQYMASGYAWAAARSHLDAQRLIGAGVGIAGLTGLASWLFGRPFLTSAHGHFHLPILGDFELASAVAFDAGVFLTVIGTILLSLATISRVEARAHREEPIAPPQSAEPRRQPARERDLVRRVRS